MQTLAELTKHAMQVRYVFENATELASMPAGQESDQEGTVSLSKVQTEASAQGILTALYSVVEDQSSEVASICRCWWFTSIPERTPGSSCAVK